jgi:hypothetical protein
MDGAVPWLVVRVVITAGVSVGTLAYAMTRRRADGSRRWPLVVAGAAGVVGAATSGILLSPDRGTEGHQAIVGFCALVVLAGLALIALGVRGRRVGDHPYCRLCGFDLFGKPETSTVCSECGSNLVARRAVVIGVRRRILWLVFVGLFVVTSGVGVALPFARSLPLKDWYNELRPRIYALKPLPWVVDDVVEADLKGLSNSLSIERLELALDRPESRNRTLRLMLDRAIQQHATSGQSTLLARWLLLLNAETFTDEEVRQMSRAALHHQSFIPEKIPHGMWFYTGLIHFPRTGDHLTVTADVETILNGHPAHSTRRHPLATTVFVVDPVAAWNHVPLGPVSIEQRIRVAVDVRRPNGRSVSETIVLSQPMSSVAVDPSHVIPPLVKPTPRDLAVRWQVARDSTYVESVHFELTASAPVSERLLGRLTMRVGSTTTAVHSAVLPKGDRSMWCVISKDQLPSGPFELIFEPDPRAVANILAIDVSPVLDLPFTVTVDPNQP